VYNIPTLIKKEVLAIITEASHHSREKLKWMSLILAGEEKGSVEGVQQGKFRYWDPGKRWKGQGRSGHRCIGRDLLGTGN